MRLPASQVIAMPGCAVTSLTHQQMHRSAIDAWSMVAHTERKTARELTACVRAGAILTKMDGDSRGGAALSVHAVSGKPIKFMGTGEGLDALEPFYPDRIASRVLGEPTMRLSDQL